MRQSPIALYTKLDADYDQQVTVVGRLLTSPGRVHRRRQVLSTTTVDSRLFAALGDGRRAVAKLSRVWDRVSEKCTLIFRDIPISLKDPVRKVEGNPCAKNQQLNPCNRFDTIPACDRQTDRQTLANS